MFWLENDFFQWNSEEQRVHSDSFPGDEETIVEVPETEDKSNNIMEHNTDRGGDLEVEDDGPY